MKTSKEVIWSNGKEMKEGIMQSPGERYFKAEERAKT